MNNINDLNLDLLRVLQRIIETQSLTETAKSLGITQSAVSHSLKKLRDFFEDELFFRNGNKLEPTDKAQTLAAPLSNWLGQLEHMLMSEVFTPEKSKKVFYIASTDIVEQLFVPKLIRVLQKKAPHIKLRFVKWVYPNVKSQILNSEMDLAIGVRTLDDPNIMQRVLYKETFISAVRKNHPMLKGKITIEKFISYPHVMTGPGDGRGAVDNYLEKLNRKRELLYSVSNFASAPPLIENSDCILTAPKKFLEHIVKKHKIELFEPPFPMQEFSIKMFWSKKNHKETSNEWLRKIFYNLSI